MIKGKELKINITMHHKYDAPQPPEQVNPDEIEDDRAVLDVVERLNNFMNGEE